jgi:hypothetical protein
MIANAQTGGSGTASEAISIEGNMNPGPFGLSGAPPSVEKIPSADEISSQAICQAGNG